MKLLKKRVRTSLNILKNEGLFTLIKKFFAFIVFKIKHRGENNNQNNFVDILFVNGCNLPHPKRYRVLHQCEQLNAYGLSTQCVEADKANINDLKYCRAVIIYRCPITEPLKLFINKAKENNKTVFFDIDDLVIDTKYTDNIEYIKLMNIKDRDLYDDGVKRIGETLSLCEHCITTTEGMRKELLNYCNDVFINRNVASERMSEISDAAIKKIQKNSEKIIIGYFSGSITHNPDFDLIADSLLKIMKKYDNVYLKIGGYLELPQEFLEYSSRIEKFKFLNWEKLPYQIASIDINIAPIQNSIFNEAKSENKWLEASLVKVPTIASNCGAFKKVIKNNDTGILSNDDEWYYAIEKLILNKELRIKIGLNAYEYVQKKYITTYSGFELAKYIQSKLNKNFMFVLPSTNISGGVQVIIKHCQILKENGYDVTILNMDKDDTNIVNKIGEINVVSNNKLVIEAYFDTMIASLWTTLKSINNYGNVKNKLYLVQSFETNFYEKGSNNKIKANATYSYKENVRYITISKWCKDWLENDYNKKTDYVPNGIDLSLFKYTERKKHQKTRILIEGNSLDYNKNVDESFKIANSLDKSKFEISYLSYAEEPKDWYQYDKFLHKVPHDQVAKIYTDNDILLKSSLLESFSYPPLEMMATGGVNVVLQNEGNKEYLKDGENCLFYEKGNIEDAVEKINLLVSDNKLRNELIKNGLLTAKERDWNKIEKDILNLYLNGEK